MRNPSSRTLGCCLIAAILAVSASPLSVAQQPRDATKSPAENLTKLAQELQKEVEQLRGWKFKRPVQTRVCSEQQLREFVEQKVFVEEYGPDALPRVQAFLRMVGLIPADCDLRKTILNVLLNQVGGFYDQTTKTLYMLNRSDMDYGPLVRRIMIAHELTHALDDQYVDLDRLIKSRVRSEDGNLAIAAVVEGSATVLMTRYTVQAMQSGEYDVSQLMQVARQEQQRSRAFMEAPPYFSALVATYVCGMFFLTGGEYGDPAGGAPIRNVGKRLLRAAKDLPSSTEQILHPRKYWDAAKRDCPVEVDDADVEHLVKHLGLHIVYRDTVGELLCAILTTDENRVLDIMAAALPTYWTNEAATGWGGDRFFLLAEGKDPESAKKNLKSLKGVWVTLWDTPDDRDEFVEDYELERDLPARTTVMLADRGAVFVYGFSPAEQRDLQRRFERTPPGLTKAGQPWRPAGKH